MTEWPVAVKARTSATFWAVVATLLWGHVAQAQVFVYPRRPNKSQVRYYDFEWQHVDILVGPDADTSKANAMDRPAAPPQTGPADQQGPGDAPHVPTDHPAPAVEPAPADPEPPSGGGAGGSAALPNPTDTILGQAPGAATAAPARDGGVGDGGSSGSAIVNPDGGASGLATANMDGGAAGIATTNSDSGTSGVATRNADGASGLATATANADGGTTSSAASAEIDLGAEPPFAQRTLPLKRDPGELLGAKSGGVRLFFYEREREVAERAAAIIVESYVYLVGQFDYVPTETFPYVLYSSYQEFLQTNLFPLQEGTLGVTSPVDLKLTLPYFGDHQLFADVSAHEMAHQFTIQKVRSATDKAELWGDPLGAIPLWFIEGLAEFYAKRGIDPEAEMLVRDIVVNPDVELGYAMLDFFEDRPWSGLWTYKVGQLRCAFLEETYGSGTIQRILEASPRLVGEVRGMASFEDFQTLLSRLTGDQPKQISAKFETWMKRRAYRTYLGSEQSTPSVEPIQDLGEQYVDSLKASPSGNLLLVRAMDPNTGRGRLTLVDHRAPGDDVLVAVDGVPGVESLHPVWGRNFDLTDQSLIFVAERGGADVLYWQPIEHKAERTVVTEVEEAPPTVEPPQPGEPLREVRPPGSEAWNVSLGVGRRREFDLGRKGLIAAYAPAFSPDGKKVAFVGFDRSGTRDVYLIDDVDSPEAGDDFTLTKLTDDLYSERQLAWGPTGIVYSSDATSHGRYNLFRIQPQPGATPERLTTEARDHQDVIVTRDNRILFTAFNRGRADVHELVDGAIVRRTDITTGLFELGSAPDGGLWALYHQAGRRRPVRLRANQLLTLETLPQPPADAPRVIEQRELADATRYDPFKPKNWELGPPFGFIGGGSGGIWGQVVASASDKLRNQALLLNVAVLGSFELTDGYLVYLNQEKRLTWGTGIFQSLVFRVDETFADTAPDLFLISAERFYGALGSLRYPFNQFVYVQGDVSIGGVNYFLTTGERLFLQDPNANFTGRDLYPEWAQANEGARFQTEATLRFGYDTIRYSAGGPIAGSSLLLEGSAAFQPFQRETFGTLRLDGERYFPLFGRTHVFVRGGAGTTFGGRLARQYLLSTFDTIRGIPYGATDWALGRHFFFTTAELQVPLNAVIRVLILTDIEAIAGVDFGGVGRELGNVWDRRVLSPVLGFNFGLGPLILRLHFAKPIDIGAPAGLPSPNGEWVTNFSIRILGFEGLFSGKKSDPGLMHERRQTLMGPHRAF